MYYNKKSGINSDYYNAYGYAHPEKEKSNGLNTLIKFLAVILLLTFILFGYILIQKEQQTEVSATDRDTVVPGSPLPTVVASTPQNTPPLSNQEIVKIVQAVMRKMKQNQTVPQGMTSSNNDDNYAKVLMNQEVDELNDKSESIDIRMVDSKKTIEQTRSLEENNHYNKVVIDETKQGKDYLARLSTELQEETSKVTEQPLVSYYTQSISKELNVRSNEMRIIVVKRGDTLSRIAHRAYGDYDAYPKILRANPEVIVNPDQIFVGQRLRIPQ